MRRRSTPEEVMPLTPIRAPMAQSAKAG